MTNVMSDPLILALPSKGRLKEQCTAAFAAAGFDISTGSKRDYTGRIAGMPGVEVKFMSSSDIAQFLKTGAIHLGVTGEDLVRETVPDAAASVRFLKRLGFGNADVVVAVPDCWIDTASMAALEQAAVTYHRVHGRRMRVATKYMNLTRRFFAERGVTSYRIVESLGATEGAPAAGLAELIVDITTTGATLRANALRPLDDGLILRSEACLVASNSAAWSAEAREAERRIVDRLA
ncbi:MAG: ATP phosphoribosyltransferase [Hyphomicrobiaceae bacterium]